MSRQDDFPKDVKEALAKRVSYRCSFPGCPKTTVGPSEETSVSTNSIGMACHISSASAGPGARRYDPTLKSEQRKAIENGIWMCYDHGTMIDKDEVRYSIPMLKKWRSIAETRTRIHLETGREPDLSSYGIRNIGLVENLIFVIQDNHENKLIGDAISDSWMPQFWGKKLSDATRDAIIEIVRNAFEHGCAKKVSLEIFHQSVRIQDDGACYKTRNLSQSNPMSGGQHAISLLLRDLSNELILTHRYENGININTIALLYHHMELLEEVPCSLEVTWNQVRRRDLSVDFDSYDGCDVIYIFLPPYMSASDSIHLNIKDKQKIEKEIIFVVTDMSEQSLSLLKSRFPEYKILHTLK